VKAGGWIPSSLSPFRPRSNMGLPRGTVWLDCESAKLNDNFGTRGWSGSKPAVHAPRCHFTGILLVEDNPRDPRYLTFDHRVPRDESDLVLAAGLINDMKSDLSEEEFRAVVNQLARRFGGGGFDDSVFTLKHWKR